MARSASDLPSGTRPDAPVPAPDPADTGFLVGPGELGGLIGRFDWAATALGPIASWPHSLRTAVSLMLNSPQPMWLGWGRDITFLYNDAYVDVLGAKHPSALGRPAGEVWQEIWDICGPLAEAVFREGRATMAEDVRLFMHRNGFVEETCYSFSYSPIRDESGKVGGLFCPNLDVTARQLYARRLRVLSEISSGTLLEKTVDGVCASAAGHLAASCADLPFSLLYLNDGQGDEARLALSAGWEDEHAGAEPTGEGRAADALPQRLPLRDHAPNPWPIARTVETGEPLLFDVSDIPGLPGGPAGQPVRQALALPLTHAGERHPFGVFVAGISPVLRLDDHYRNFLGLLATQLTNALRSARIAEEEKLRADMLAELDAAKTMFFSNISHEFRTPLTLMLGPAEEALTDPAERLGPAQRARLELVHRNALRLQKLVNSLLDFSRIQAGGMTSRPVPTDLATWTADLCSGFRSTVEHAGMRLEVDCPPLDGPVLVDPDMWEKVVLNLVSNAFKFTFEGGIAVRLREEAGTLHLTVADTGVGIPAEELPRVFERFHRVAGARGRTHEGSGIGLALVRDLVHLHGGDIAVESSIGRGTTFHVTLPARHAAIGESPVPAGRESGASAAPPLSSLTSAPSTSADSAFPPSAASMASLSAARTADRLLHPTAALRAFVAEAQRWLPDDAFPPPEATPLVPTSGLRQRLLIADDNADMRDYLRRLLAARWEVETVANGDEALAALRRQVPDLILSDVMMPGLDGFGLLKAVRADPALRRLPVVLLSARAGEEAQVDGLAAGADAYLVKPFSGRELIARIEAMLLHHRLSAAENLFLSRMQAVFEHAPVSIAITRGPQHVFEVANPEYRALAGSRDVVGRPYREALPELEGQGVYELLDEVFATSVPYTATAFRVSMQRRPNRPPEESFFNFVFQPMQDVSGRTEGIAIICYDVTELMRAKHAAESASRTKDEFLAMLGHELRNPLAPIITALQIMRLRGVPMAEKEIAIIERQASHLVALVDDLLDVARVAQGKIQLRRRAIEVADIVARAIETASPLLEEKLQRLTVDVPAQGCLLHGDPERLAQVVANLLTNAAKYSEPQRDIAVCATQEGDIVEIVVSDEGIGIDADVLPRIFESFVQDKQASSRSLGGLGLGLAIARSMTEAHGGTIAAYSEGRGRGSRFVVRLPLAVASLPATSAPEPDPDPVAARGAGTLTVLLVDDNIDAAHMLADALGHYGCRVSIAHDGPSALHAAAAEAPDVALLDIGLPGMDGYELADRLRMLPGLADLHLVAITGYGQSSDRYRAAEAGFDEHFVKPVHAADVFRYLSRTIAQGSA